MLPTVPIPYSVRRHQSGETPSYENRQSDGPTVAHSVRRPVAASSGRIGRRGASGRAAGGTRAAGHRGRDAPAAMASAWSTARHRPHRTEDNAMIWRSVKGRTREARGTRWGGGVRAIRRQTHRRRGEGGRADLTSPTPGRRCSRYAHRSRTSCSSPRSRHSVALCAARSRGHTSGRGRRG